jgi:hypothetical protein
VAGRRAVYGDGTARDVSFFKCWVIILTIAVCVLIRIFQISWAHLEDSEDWSLTFVNARRLTVDSAGKAGWSKGKSIDFGVCRPGWFLITLLWLCTSHLISLKPNFLVHEVDTIVVHHAFAYKLLTINSMSGGWYH